MIETPPSTSILLYTYRVKKKQVIFAESEPKVDPYNEE